MPRPVKGRRVGYVPEATHFKPAGIPIRSIEEISLSFEELEAMRLKDREGLQQEECASRMGISRPTFHRVLGSARAKVAEALTMGKAIRIGGGNFEVQRRRLRCDWDGHEWEVPLDMVDHEDLSLCPRCQKPYSEPAPPAAGARRQIRGGRRRGRGWRR
ncbi:MAG: DUF134 domain-containing protein [Dehalococcoidia bacterium]